MARKSDQMTPPAREKSRDSIAQKPSRSSYWRSRLSVANSAQLRQIGQTWSRFRSNPGGVVGLIAITTLALVAILGPAVTRYDPSAINAESLLSSPGIEHWFGTDQYGRDIFTRIVHGASLSLTIGLVSVTISVVVGCVLGLFAGYFGWWIDNLIMRFIDILLAFPGILLALAIVAILGPSLTNVMIAVGISAIPNFTRVMRGSVLSAKEQTYVEAAVSIGCKDSRILFMHIVPNVSAPIIVLATLGVPSAILIAAGLSFIGLGAQPPTPEWGAMLNDGRQYLYRAWWITTFPGFAIMVTVLAINLIGDALRDALDPRLRMR
jgi:peptide/nickel transport system permease protein